MDRSQLPIYEHQRELYQQKVDAAKLATVAHDMRQGYVLTQYFYEQLLQFEKDPASLKDTIGEMVYGMDVDQQVHRARQTEFDKVGDEDVLQQSKPHPLTGLDLAEAKLASGDIPAATAMAQKALAGQTDTVASTADAARAHFILARVDLNDWPSRRERSMTSRKPSPRARNSGCWPGRIFILAACWTWNASATRLWRNTTKLWLSATVNSIRASPPSGA